MIKPSNKGLNVNPHNLSTAEALELRRKLAKRLNQRMRALEKAGYTSEEGGAYAEYKDLLEKFFPGRSRIPENLIPGQYLPRQEVHAIQKILREKTSLVFGWNEIIENRRKALEEYGIVFKSNDEMRTFFSSYAFKNLDKFYNSKQLIRIITHKMDSMSLKDILKSLEEFRNRNDPDTASDIAKKLGFKNEAEALEYPGLNK